MTSIELHKFSYNSNLPIFFNYEYYNTSDGNYILLQDKDIILPISITKKYIFKIGTFLYKPIKIDGSEVTEKEENDFLITLKHYLNANNICDILNRPIHVCVFKSIPKGFEGQKHGLIYINIKKDFETIFSEFASSNRTQIRQCQRLGYKVSFNFTEEECKQFYTYYKLNLQRQNLHFYPFNQINKWYKLRKNGVILASVYNEKGVYEGGALIIHSKKNAHYFIAAKNEDIKLHKGSQKLLQYEIIQKLQKEGLEKYYLGGRNVDNASIKKRGIEEYKESFGSEIEWGYLLNANINIKAKAYSLLLNLYLKLK